MARKRVALKGVGRVRRLMKRLPDDARRSMIEIYRQELPVIVATMKANTPVRTGRLRAAISGRVLERSTTMLAGIIGKPANRKFFYGRILEDGRGFKKARTRLQTRARPSGGRSRPFTARISVISRSRYDFVKGRVAARILGGIRPRLAGVWTRALQRAAGEEVTGDE